MAPASSPHPSPQVLQHPSPQVLQHPSAAPGAGSGLSAGLSWRARLAHWVMGTRPPRLREQTHRASALSYLLFLASSVATVLTLGHAQIPLLLAGSDIVVRVMSGLALGLLVASVYAADMAMLATVARVPVLARNRAHVALVEHVAYAAFVLGVETVTYGVVMAVLDTDPHALLTARALVPLSGWLFVSQIAARAVLLGWTGLQLFIVRRPLPPMPATLSTRAQELIGGDALARLSGLSTRGLSIADAVNAYLVLCRRPRRIRSWWNGWLFERDLEREREENRQRQGIVEAIGQLEGAGTRFALGGDGDGGAPPTGPGSPVVADGGLAGGATSAQRAVYALPAPSRRAAAAVAATTSTRRAGTGSRRAGRARARTDEERGAVIRELLNEDRRMGVNEIMKRAGVNVKDATRWRNLIMSEQAQQAAQQAAQQTAQRAQ